MQADYLAPGTVLSGKYRLIRPLGTGATGAVWLADSNDGSEVACKVLHPDLNNNPKLVERLRKESEILSRLTHESIARHIEVSTEPPLAYLVMDFIDGRPLHEVLGERVIQGDYLPGRAIRGLFGQICDALTYAHNKYIVHRDVKPHNLMVVSGVTGPRVKVLDFGHARLLDGCIFDATTVGRKLGSPLYMSPEQALGLPATVRTDVFALATVLFEVISLRRAWVRDEDDRPLFAFCTPPPHGFNDLAMVFERITKGPRPRLLELRPQISSSLDEAITTALAIEPNDRPETIDEFRRAVWPGLSSLTDEPVQIDGLADRQAALLFDRLSVEPGIDPLDLATQGGTAEEARLHDTDEQIWSFDSDGGSGASYAYVQSVNDSHESAEAPNPVRAAKRAKVGGPPVPQRASAMDVARRSRRRTRDRLWLLVVLTAGLVGLAVGTQCGRTRTPKPAVLQPGADASKLVRTSVVRRRPKSSGVVEEVLIEQRP